MRTPFDTVLRTRKREIDHVRIALHAQNSRLVEIDDASDALCQEVAREYSVAADQWAGSGYAYMRRRMAERTQLKASRLAACREIERLRYEAAEAYGSLVVLEDAAERFRFEVRRKDQRLEQQSADDLGAIRFARSAHVRKVGGSAGSR